MKEYFKGKGNILHNGKQICSGFYNITKDSTPDTQIRQSGVITVSGINTSELLAIFKLLQPPQPSPELILVIEGGRKFNINLTLVPISGSFDFGSDSAQFKIWFLPGNPEI